MSKLVSTSMLAVGALCAAVGFASPAGAEPAEPPCDLALALLCRMIPTAPELEGDIDLTNQSPGADSGLLLPDSAQPADPCVNGCI